MSKKLTVIRTAVGSPAAMGLVQELKRRNVRVIGLDCDPYSAGLYLCDRGYVVPRGDDVKFLDKLLEICDIEKPNMIISGPEEEMLTLSKNRELFEEKKVLLLLPPYETVKLCSDKLETWKKLKELGIPVPEIYPNTKPKFPCVVKPRLGRGGREIFVANDDEELRIFLKKVRNPIVQEYVGGTEYTVDTFADMTGDPLSIVPRIRLGVESGISVKGITVYDRDIISYCKKIVRSLKLFGPACIQCIKDGKEVKFTEINTRFGGGSILSIKADPSIIINLIRIAQGKAPIRSQGFKRGLVMLRYYSEVFVSGKKIMSHP